MDAEVVPEMLAVAVSSSRFSASFTSQSSSIDSSDNEVKGLIHELEQELETTIQQKNINIELSKTKPSKGPIHELEHELENTIHQKNINLDDTPSPKATPKLKAIEPSKIKPSKKFISPIQLYQVGS